MPTSLMFAACQNVLTDEAQGSYSLISLLDGISLVVAQDQDVPVGATIPLAWYAVTTWLRVPDDEGRSYEIKISTTYPDGYETEGTVLPLQLSEHITRSSVKIASLRVGPPGEYVLRAYLREVQADQWNASGQHIYMVRHVLPQEG